MGKIKKLCSNNENRMIVCIFVITMLFACGPLFTKYCINGHDLEYHLLRIESLKEGILMGKPFLKVNVLYFGGAGYASSLFYPDFLLYIPALLRVLGFSINLSYHIFVAICFILCFFSAYYCVSRMTKSCYAGLIAAILWSLCSYHMDDVYVRGAVGEFLAFLFLPFVIYGIYLLIYEDFEKPWILGIGFGGVLLCHTNTVVMCLMLMVGVLICKIRVFLKAPKRLGRLILTGIVTACVTMPYWLSVMEQLAGTRFYVNTPWMQPKDEALQFMNIFYPEFPALGFMLVLFLLPRVLLRKTQENQKLVQFADELTLAGALFACLATDLLPWDKIGQYVTFIQFPWRFFIMSSALFATAGALVIFCMTNQLFVSCKNQNEQFIADKKGMVVLIVLGMMIAASTCGLLKHKPTYYDYGSDYYSYKPYTGNVIGGEWLPETVTDRDALVEDSEKLLTNEGEELEFSRIQNAVVVKIPGNVEYVDVPLIFYKGYQATMKLKDGSLQAMTVDGKGHNGFCRVYTEGTEGELTVVYGKTMLQTVSLIVSFLSILLLGYGIFMHRKKSGRVILPVLLAAMVCMISGCKPVVNITPADQIQATGKTLFPKEESDDTILVDNQLEESKESEISENAFTRINRTGYECNDNKIAVFCVDSVIDFTNASFQLVEQSSDEIVFSGSLTEGEQNGEMYYAYGDFSEYKKEGTYLIRSQIAQDSEPFVIETDHYQRLLKKEMDNNKDLTSNPVTTEAQAEEALMRICDLVLTHEFFAKDEVKPGSLCEELTLAKAQVQQIYPLDITVDVANSYRYSAVIAMFAQVYNEYDKKEAKELLNYAEQMYEDMESLMAATDMKESYDDAKFFAASWLYKATGKQEYRTVAEEYLEREIPTGFSMKRSGYLGSIGYLTTTNKTSLDISTKAMQDLFSHAIALIDDTNKTPYYISSGTRGDEEEAVLLAYENARLLSLVNSVSMSIDYVDAEKNQIDYLCGRNETGAKYISDSGSKEPSIFLLSGMLNSYIIENK